MEIEDHLSKAFTVPKFSSPSSWTQHIPFANFLISYFKPKVFVELGVFNGMSFFSFCQAIKEQGIDCKAYGVDTWQGDGHSGPVMQGVFEDLQLRIKENYGSSAELLRMTFDESADRFKNGSIDLLHIDGFHTYEAVKHDFDVWLPKMNENGIIIFHDIAVTGAVERDLFEKENLDFDSIVLRLLQKGYITNDHCVNPDFIGLDSEFQKWFPHFNDVQFNKIQLILFHLIKERDFGVWKLWDELKEKYPNFSFKHGHGLGVLFVGRSFHQPEPCIALFNTQPFYDLFFKRLGYLLELELKYKISLKSPPSLSDRLFLQLRSTYASLPNILKTSKQRFK